STPLKLIGKPCFAVVSSARWDEEETLTTTPRPRASCRPSRSKAFYPMACETFADVAEDLPRFLDEVYNRRRLHSSLGYLRPQQFEDRYSPPPVKSAA